MKKFFKRLTASLFMLIFLTSFANASAVQTDYADIKGHWAETALIWALNDTLITAAGDSLQPNEPLTGSEILKILCRVLSANRAADISGISDVTKDDPYYTIASQAVALGLTAPLNGRLDLNKPVTRSKAFSILAEAFQLNNAIPDTSVLSNFSDGDTLSGKYRLAAASLISNGFIGGFNGSLHINDNISLAEFITILHKILPNEAGSQGGIVVSGNTPVSNREFTGNIYFDCSSSIVQLHNMSAPAVIIRSDSLNALSVASSKINRLVFSAGSGDIYFSPDFTSSIATAVIGTGGGKMTFGGSLTNIEVTGSNRVVTLTSSVKNLFISGSGNKIVLVPGVTVDTVRVLGDSTGNTVTVNGIVEECRIDGHDTVIDGNGTVQNLLDYSKNSTVTASTVTASVIKDYGLNSVELTLEAPDSVPSYETLKASVSIKAPAGSTSCRGAWYIDDTFISESDVSLGTISEVTLSADIRNSSNVPVASTLSFVLSCVNADGYYQELRADKSVTLMNSEKFNASEILALVTTGYKGNYTLSWAKLHDYDAAVKTEWVNLKGYSSKTSYLVWVSIAYQRVNVFKGSAGKWMLDRTFIVGTGATGKDTPTGVFKVIGRSTKGWTTKAYTVKPVVLFYNYAYGFHSRLYDPGTTKLNDARIGFPVSHGCVRMYDEDVAWFYDNIPYNTTVVVY